MTRKRWHPHLHKISLICAGRRSADMAAGFGPDCRNTSSEVENRTAGKETEQDGEKEGGDWDGLPLWT